eukprot:4636461-Amphidinium_carterae.1
MSSVMDVNLMEMDGVAGADVNLSEMDGVTGADVNLSEMDGGTGEHVNDMAMGGDDGGGVAVEVELPNVVDVLPDAVDEGTMLDGVGEAGNLGSPTVTQLDCQQPSDLETELGNLLEEAIGKGELRTDNPNTIASEGMPAPPVGGGGPSLPDLSCGAPAMPSMGSGGPDGIDVGGVKRDCDGEDVGESVVKKQKIDNDILAMWESDDFTSLVACESIVITPEVIVETDSLLQVTLELLDKFETEIADWTTDITDDHRRGLLAVALLTESTLIWSASSELLVTRLLGALFRPQLRAHADAVYTY